MSNKKDHDNLEETQVTHINFREYEPGTIDLKPGVKSMLVPVLRILKGNSFGKPFIVSQNISTIGRDRKNDFYFSDPKISRNHCTIIMDFIGEEKHECKISLEDNNSSNGTYLNQKLINNRVELTHGDHIEVGARCLGFYLKYPEEVEIEKYLYNMATHDLETGLLNRSNFLSTLDFEYQRSKVYSRNLSLILLDLDNFKNINDSYGHLVGDRVLKLLGKIIIDSIRYEDVPIRFGGEEFAIILPETSIKEAKLVADRLKNSIFNYDFFINNQKIDVTASFGVSELTQKVFSSKHLIKLADDALYRAKKTGKNKVEIAS